MMMFMGERVDCARSSEPNPLALASGFIIIVVRQSKETQAS
jgi:hypothetical protein